MTASLRSWLSRALARARTKMNSFLMVLLVPALLSLGSCATGTSSRGAEQAPPEPKAGLTKSESPWNY